MAVSVEFPAPKGLLGSSDITIQRKTGLVNSESTFDSAKYQTERDVRKSVEGQLCSQCGYTRGQGCRNNGHRHRPLHKGRVSFPSPLHADHEQEPHRSAHQATVAGCEDSKGYLEGGWSARQAVPTLTTLRDDLPRGAGCCPLAFLALY